ncbi:MAG: hypothetical protein R3E95_13075 [Thiolinea sp.]
MSATRYDLVILHHTSDKTVETLVQDLLVLLDKVGDPYLEYKLSEALLFEKSSSAILDGIDEEQGKYYQDEFRKLKVETELRPTLQLVDKETENEDDKPTYTCPACGHQQPQAGSDDMNTCNQCGVVGEKFSKSRKRQEVFETEKRKMEQQRQKDKKAAQEQADMAETEAMRQEARARLGIREKFNIKDKGQAVSVLVGAAVVSVMGVAGYFIMDTLSSGADPAETSMVQGDAPASGEPQEKGKGGVNLTIQGGNGTIVVGDKQLSAAGKSGPEGLSNEPASGTGLSSETAQASGMTSETPASDAPASAQQMAALTPDNAPQTAAKRQNTASTSAAEIAILKQLLTPAQDNRARYFKTLSAPDYQEYRQQVERLLELNKPELALVFAEELEDPYVAALLIMQISQSPAFKQRSTLQDSVLLSLKNLAAQTVDRPQNALLSAALAQGFALSGDQDSAVGVLDAGIASLTETQHELAQRYAALAQMERDLQEFGHAEGAKRISAAMQTYTARLPGADPLQTTRNLTQLAASELASYHFESAQRWLQQVPAADARTQLLAHLDNIKANMLNP